MKKLSLILATIMMLALCVSSFSIGISAAKPIDAFTQVDPVPEENQINSTTWNHFVGMNQLENPVGNWSWASHFEGKDGCWGMNQSGTYLDSDLKTVIIEYKDVDYSDKGATSVKEFVFADLFTQSGVGDFGRIKASMEDVFDEMTVVCSDDGENWTEIEFTVAYHTQESTYTDWYGNARPVDTYWHLIFNEEVPAHKYFALHTSETKGWDADDHAPKLGILLDWKYVYLVKGAGEAAGGDNTEETEEIIETTEAPVTEPETTVAPETDPVTTEASAPDPVATEAPGTAETDDTKADAENDMTWLYIVIAVAVVAVVVIVIVVAKKKK